VTFIGREEHSPQRTPQWIANYTIALFASTRKLAGRLRATPRSGTTRLTEEQAMPDARNRPID